MESGPDDIAEVAEAILRYLAEHPRASDTLDGIVHFWLQSHYSPMRVMSALNALQRRGLVATRPLAAARSGQTVLYSAVRESA